MDPVGAGRHSSAASRLADHGHIQTLLWLAALLGDYLGTRLAGTRWRLNSPSHFAERHGLIIIVALSESIVSIGIGVAALPISWPIIVASALGPAVSAALWWAYFDVTALIAERALAAAEGARQIRLARGGYSFLHLPMVIGVIMMALGLKKVLGYVGGDDGHVLADPIYGVRSRRRTAAPRCTCSRTWPSSGT